MKRIILLSLILLCSAITLFAGDQRLAVLDTIIDQQVDGSVQVPVTEKMIELFINNTGYRVIDRTDIQSVLEEKNFQLSGMVRTEEVREVGRYLGADYICIAKVSLVGQTYFLSAKLIDVMDGTIVSQATAEQRGSVEIVLQLAEYVGQKLIRGSAGAAVAKTSEKSENFIFNDVSGETQPGSENKSQVSPAAPGTGSGNRAVSASKGGPASMLFMGFSLPVFMGPAYDSLNSDIETYYGSTIERWGIGFRARGFWPVDNGFYIYADWGVGTDYIDYGSGESLSSLLVNEFIVGSGMYLPLGPASIMYVGAGIGYLNVTLQDDVDAWDLISVDSVGGFAYNVDMGVAYTMSSSLVMDFKLSLSSGKMDEEELFGFSSQGFGVMNFCLMAGLTI